MSSAMWETQWCWHGMGSWGILDQGLMKWDPFWRDQNMQMYGSILKDFPTNVRRHSMPPNFFWGNQTWCQKSMGHFGGFFFGFPENHSAWSLGWFHINDPWWWMKSLTKRPPRLRGTLYQDAGWSTPWPCIEAGWLKVHNTLCGECPC